MSGFCQLGLGRRPPDWDRRLLLEVFRILNPRPRDRRRYTVSPLGDVVECDEVWSAGEWGWAPSGPRLRDLSYFVLRVLSPDIRIDVCLHDLTFLPPIRVCPVTLGRTRRVSRGSCVRPEIGVPGLCPLRKGTRRPALSLQGHECRRARGLSGCRVSEPCESLGVAE